MLGTLFASERLRSAWHLTVIALLGFASGLPLALTGYAMQAWLTVEGVNVATIGAFSLVALPYTFKFLWAPLMDRFDVPVLGRRRGWVVLSQLGLGISLLALAATPLAPQTRGFAALAVLVAFMSASQDIVIDAYRTELLPRRVHGLGSSLFVLGYRLAMVLSGGIALIWTDVAVGGGWTWPQVYRLMAALMFAAAVFSMVALPPIPKPTQLRSPARRELIGFAAVVAAVGLGWLLTDWLIRPGAAVLIPPTLGRGSLDPSLQRRWVDLAALLSGVAVTVPLVVLAARRARFETLLSGLSDFFAQPGAWTFLVFIVLYRMGDAFSGSLTTTFLLKSVSFSSAEVGVANRIVGLWLVIAGGLVGGALMLRLGLWRSLLVFGLLRAISTLGYLWLAVGGKGLMGGVELPALDWGFVRLAQITFVDGGLLAVVAFESVTGGMVMAAFIALLMGLCNQQFTATQFALLSALASIGRIWVGPVAGVVAESAGWTLFFAISTALALPGLWMLFPLRKNLPHPQ